MTAAEPPELEVAPPIAGFAVAQDCSERRLQMASSPPQFSLGESYPGFGPLGPWLVTLAEFDDPNDLELGCSIDGEQVQLGRTRDLIFSVPALVRSCPQRCHCCPATSSSWERRLASVLGARRRGGCRTAKSSSVTSRGSAGCGTIRHAEGARTVSPAGPPGQQSPMRPDDR